MDKAGQAGAAAGAGAGAGAAAEAPPSWFTAAFETLKTAIETSVDKKINAIDKRLKSMGKTGADPDPAAGADPAAAGSGADPAVGADPASGAHAADPKANAELMKLRQQVETLRQNQEKSDKATAQAQKDRADMEIRAALTEAMGGDIPWSATSARDLLFTQLLPQVKKDEAGRFVIENEAGLPLLARDYVEQRVTKDQFLLKAEGRRGSGATNGTGTKPWEQSGISPADITPANMADPNKRAQATAEIAAAIAAGQK